LLLSTRKGAPRLVAAFAQARKAGEHGFHVFFHRGAVGLPVGAHFQVFPHAHRSEDAPSFGHVDQPAAHDLLRGDGADLFTAVGDAAAGRAQDAGNRVEAGGFTRAVGADERHDLTLLERKAHVFERVNGAVMHVEVGDVENHADFLPRYFLASAAPPGPRYASMTRSFF